ncbi:MAG: type VI secretion system-associated protein TagF [Labilithrix sp.]|nr:type VI secretion system-associated protein TagF [Labilithrix sp.]MCW5811453.1 type VI secretion system-associated protein TagF [Labilithrix sp.]
MFGFLGKKARSEVGKVEGVAKVPALGDFVRTPSPSDELLAFEAWVTRALETAEARGASFKDAFAAGAAHAFVWSGALDKKLRGVFAGVLAPSHDAVGRRFPIVLGVAVPVASLATQPHTAPLLLHELFQHAAAAAARVRQARSASELHAHVASIAPPSLDDVGGCLTRYAEWAKNARASDASTALYGGDAGWRHALGTIVDATAAYRGQDAPPLSLGVRVPLGAQHGNQLAMWLDFVRSAAGWKSTVPTLFFPLAGTSALIQLGAEAPASVLVDLFAPSRDSNAVCDVTNADAAPPPASARAEVYAATSLADVATELAR